MMYWRAVRIGRLSWGPTNCRKIVKIHFRVDCALLAVMWRLIFQARRLDAGCARTTDLPFLVEVGDREDLALGRDQHEVMHIQADCRAISVGKLESRVRDAGPRRRHKVAAHS